jgi:uncharacterized protein YjiS (DUF1127 family)
MIAAFLEGAELPLSYRWRRMMLDLRQSRARRRTVRALAQLPPEILRDIGLDPSQVAFAAATPAAITALASLR